MSSPTKAEFTRFHRLRIEIGSAAFDVFCSANFLNFMPWHASIDYLLTIGIAAIKEHNHALFEKFVGGIDETTHRLIGPSEQDSRSTIVTISHIDSGRNREIYILSRGQALTLRCAAEIFDFRFTSTTRLTKLAVPLRY